MSKEMQGIVNAMRAMGQRAFGDGELDVARLRATVNASYAGQAMPEGVTMELCELGGVESAVFMPADVREGAAQDGGLVIYYVHGGGLVTGDRMTAGPYAGELALASGCPVVASSYRLAPEHPFPAGLDDVYATYRAIGERWPGASVAAIGDSAGAHYSLALAVKCLQEGVEPPSSLVLNSVVADLSDTIERPDTPLELVVSNPALEELAKLYAPDVDRANPLVSPILADFEGLPPMRVVCDKDELLAPDARAVAEKARAAGIEVESVEYEGCFHAFTTLGTGAPESARELELSVAFMLSHR